MLTTEAPEFNASGVEDANLGERPPAFNPEARRTSSWGASSFSTNTNDCMLHEHSSEQPPPYYDPNLDENVVWDENLSPERDNSLRDNEDAPVTPRHDDGEYMQSPSSTSPAKYWQTTKEAARTTWIKVKKFEEKHEISTKTKQGAKSVYKSTKRATITASRKVKEFDEKHQVVAKSKRGVANGASYVSSKCSRRQIM